MTSAAKLHYHSLLVAFNIQSHSPSKLLKFSLPMPWSRYLFLSRFTLFYFKNCRIYPVLVLRNRELAMLLKLITPQAKIPYISLIPALVITMYLVFSKLTVAPPYLPPFTKVFVLLTTYTSFASTKV